METKPFAIQSPEAIAKDYGGNKQKIAEAMQMGLVDPTAGLLAGMFIDRMRNAQMGEQAPQQTVAQQVFAPPAPPAPPAGQAMPPVGLGAIAPQGAGAAPPMMPPEAGLGAMSPEDMMPPQGMAMGGAVAPYPASLAPGMYNEPNGDSVGAYAEGGLAALDVPEGALDYAGGGLVAFADGGSTGGWGDYIEQMVRRLDPNIEISGRARTPARNAEVGGVPNSFHMIDAARDIRTPEGMNKPEFIAQLKSVFGSDYDILPSKGRSVHIEPGPALGKRVRAGVNPSNVPATIPKRDLATPEGFAQSAEDFIGRARNLYGDLPEAGLGRMKEYYEKQLDPEELRKERKADMWATLAQLGASLASSRSPDFLQSVGEAIAATLPGADASRKERKAAERDALRALTDIYGFERNEGKEIIKTGVEMQRAAAAQQMAQSEMGLKARQVATQEFSAKSEADYRKGLLLIEDYKAKHPNATDFDTMLRIMQSGTPEEKAAMEAVLQKKQQYAPSAASTDIFGNPIGGKGPTQTKPVDVGGWND